MIEGDTNGFLIKIAQSNMFLYLMQGGKLLHQWLLRF